MKSLFKILAVCLLFAVPVTADDAASVETEALEISDRLRCLVCADENIETANDETAQDIRFFIRKHLTDGKSQDLVVHLLLAQYGDMISLEDAPVPTAENEKAFIFITFTVCLGAMAFYIFRRSNNFTA